MIFWSFRLLSMGLQCSSKDSQAVNAFLFLFWIIMATSTENNIRTINGIMRKENKKVTFGSHLSEKAGQLAGHGQLYDFRNAIAKMWKENTDRPTDMHIQFLSHNWVSYGGFSITERFMRCSKRRRVGFSYLMQQINITLSFPLLPSSTWHFSGIQAISLFAILVDHNKML